MQKIKNQKKRNTQKNLLLMTATIEPFVHTVSKNAAIRRQEYADALEKYIVISDFTDIVFAENSGAYFDKEKFYDLAKKHNKNFEYLDVSPYIDKTYCDIGTAESLLLRSAFQHSSLLKNFRGGIWKVTGKLWITNINKILRKTEKALSVFLYLYSEDYIQTYLYKMDIDVMRVAFEEQGYCSIFAEIEKAGEWGVMERGLRKILENAFVKATPFPIFPEFESKAKNACGLRYSRGFLGRIKRNFLLFLGCYTVPYKRKNTTWFGKFLISSRELHFIQRFGERFFQHYYNITDDILKYGFGYCIKKRIYNFLARY